MMALEAHLRSQNVVPFCTHVQEDFSEILPLENGHNICERNLCRTHGATKSRIRNKNKRYCLSWQEVLCCRFGGCNMFRWRINLGLFFVHKNRRTNLLSNCSPVSQTALKPPTQNRYTRKKQSRIKHSGDRLKQGYGVTKSNCSVANRGRSKANK